MTLGKRIRELRDERDISLREFAKKLGCSAAYWSDVELGRRYASELMLKDAARILKVAFDELKALDARPPIEEMKRNPQYAIAFRRVMENKIPPEVLLKIAGEAGKKKKP